MEIEQELPPAYSHDPDTLQLPSVPSQEPPSNNTAAPIHLPDLKSLNLPESTPRNHPAAFEPGQSQWPQSFLLQASSFPQAPITAPRSMVDMVDRGSPMDMGRPMSVDNTARFSTPSVSMEDPDVRVAAEALSGLGNPDFMRSPSNMSGTMPSASNSSSKIQTQEPEPLLSLLTSSHPWVGGTINGSLSAYSTTKAYTPRFVRYGAEFVERKIGSPVVNTVSSVGKRTGVEGSIRRYLGEHRRPSDLEQPEADDMNGHKRRRMSISAEEFRDVEKGLVDPMRQSRSRTMSQVSSTDTLPAYDENRSPIYEENVSTPQLPNERVRWPTQLVISTSGLGAALNESSLRSLKYCLGLLRSATERVDNVMNALKMVLEDYERAMQQEDRNSVAAPASEKERRCREIADRMKKLSNDIWQTLKTVVDSVSKYTGGALPENASLLVRRQLMSVPQRWHAVSVSTAESTRRGPEEVRGANRMLAFAKEGLDMMAQVSKVVDGTIVSAESWLEKMGRNRRRTEPDSLPEKRDGPYGPVP